MIAGTGTGVTAADLADGAMATSRISSRTAEVVVLLVVLTVAALLRFAALGDRSLWFDEAFAVQVARQPIARVVPFVRENDTHPPLYYVLLSVWMREFGIGEAAARALGATASALTVGVTWWMGRRLGGPLVGGIAAFLTAVAPYHIQAAQEARMYPLLGLLTALSWAALMTAVDGRRWGWLAYIAVTVAALYTHYFALFNLAGQALYVLTTARRARAPWLASQLVVLLCYLPWAGVLLDTFFSGKGWPFFRPPLSLGTLTGLLGLFSFGGHTFGFRGYYAAASASLPVQLGVLLPFLALAALGARALRSQRQALWWVSGYLVVPLVIVLLFSLRRNIFYGRYFSYLVPAFAVLLAAGIVRVGAAVAPQARRATVLALVLTLLVVNGLTLHAVYTDPRLSFQNWRGAVALLARDAGPSDAILVIPSYGFLPFSYYFKGPQRVVPVTPAEIHDVRRGRALLDPEAEARNRREFRLFADGHPVMWVVIMQPIPQTALERLGRLTAGIYDMRAVVDFNDVRVFKTVRNPGWKTAQ